MTSWLNGVSASTSTQAGHFTDNNGQPKLWVASETWNLVVNAGRWSGSGGGATPEADFDWFFSQRGAQGLTVTMVDPVAGIANDDTAGNVVYADGRTWDGIYPFTVNGTPGDIATGSETLGLNSAFWARVDYMISSAASNGITIGLVFNSYSFSTTGGDNAFTNLSTAQATAYGELLGARYASTQNLVFLFGNDEDPGSHDTWYSNWITGIHTYIPSAVVIAWWYSDPDTTSRYTSLPGYGTPASLGISASKANFCYTYNAAYYMIEFAYGEVIHASSTTPDLLPPIWGDGPWLNDNPNSGYYAAEDRFIRQATWWVLADGGRGFLSEAEDIWHWDSGAYAAVTNGPAGYWFLVNNLPNIVTAYTSWAGGTCFSPTCLLRS